MKKEWLIAVVLLLSTSLVRAEITLDGPFYNAYNLGDRLNLAANVVYPNALNGFLRANLLCENNSLDYYLVPVELSAGTVKRIQISELLIQVGYTGNCNVVVELLNGGRHTLEKSQSGKLVMSDMLKIDGKISKLNLKPGEKLVVSGTVRNIRGEKLRDGDVSLVLVNEFFTSVKDGEFGYEFTLSQDFKSGSHDLLVNVGDENGNKGIANYSFNVEAVPKRLENKLNDLSFKPRDLVVIQPVLYDQAGEIMQGDAFVKLYDPNDDLVLQRTMRTDDKAEYNLPDYAEPGEWRLVISSNGLQTENNVNVDVVEKLDFVIDDQKVVVTNVGNILYKKPIEVFLGEGETILTKETALKPGETAIIDLSKEEVPSGSYNIEVSGGETKEKFDQVEVQHEGKSLGETIGEVLPGTGMAVLGTADDPVVNPYYAGLAGLGATMASYFGYRQWRRRNKLLDKTKTMQIREAEKMAKEIKARKEKQPYKYKSDQDKQKELIEYRDRILAGIEKEKKSKEFMERKAAMEAKRDEYSYKDAGQSDWLGQENKYDVNTKDSGKTEESEGFGNQKIDSLDAEEEDFTIGNKKKKKDDGDGYFNLFGE